MDGGTRGDGREQMRGREFKKELKKNDEYRAFEKWEVDQPLKATGREKRNRTEKEKDL